MNQGLRQSMAWLHTWAGLLLGWLLYAMFVTGTSAFFQEETTRWMTPEVQATATDRIAGFENAVAWVTRNVPDAPEVTVLSSGRRAAGLELYWQNGPKAPADAPYTARLDGAGQEVSARETRGGFFLYRFHFDLHYLPVMWARYLVGIAAMAMLIAILSGIVTHKKIIADFFLMRLGKGQRSWLDAHNVSSVLFLPFVLMITYTGLVSLAVTYMPWGVTANFADQTKYFETAFYYPLPPERAGVAAQAPLRPILEGAGQRLGTVGAVRILNPGDRTARVIVSGAPDGAMSARVPSLTYEGTTGRLLSVFQPAGAASATESVMIGLHAGRYAWPVLRWLYFFSGLAGCVMVASGLVLWAVKRRSRLKPGERGHFGLVLVEKLNVGAIVGLPIGLATYFLANRLLPVGIAGRADAEIDALFIAWGAAFAWAALRPTRLAWRETLAVAALGFAAVPLVNAVTTDRNLFASLAAGDWVFAGFDLMMLALAAGFALACRRAVAARPFVRPSARRAVPA